MSLSEYRGSAWLFQKWMREVAADLAQAQARGVPCGAKVLYKTAAPLKVKAAPFTKLLAWVRRERTA